jgi:hypothetical protein
VEVVMQERVSYRVIGNSFEGFLAAGRCWRR